MNITIMPFSSQEGIKIEAWIIIALFFFIMWAISLNLLFVRINQIKKLKKKIKRLIRKIKS